MSDNQIVAILESRKSQYTAEAIAVAVGELDSRGKYLLFESPQFARFATFPFICPNCDRRFDDATVYCSGRCEDEAAFVRYFRNCLRDDRFSRADIQEVFGKRLALLLSRSYSDRDRRLSKRVRQSIIARDHELCRRCGAPGVEIDHILGNSSDLANLQLLCKACHEEKTNRSFVPIPPESLVDEMAKRKPVIDRVVATYPSRPSDDPALWKHLWRTIRSLRNRVVLERKMRRCGTKCPVCLAPLPRRTRAEYLRTGERHMRRCAKCFAERTNGIACSACGAEAVWRNVTMAACQACATQGTVEQVALSALLNAVSFDPQ